MSDKCQHLNIVQDKYVSGAPYLGVYCADCRVPMKANSKGSEFLDRQGRVPWKPIPLESRYWKVLKVPKMLDPMSYESRMRGYENIYMVRR